MPGQKLLSKHKLDILNMEPAGLPSNTSHQQLMTRDDGDSTDPSLATSSSIDDIKMGEEKTTCNVTTREWFTIAILCFVNLINYMDRFTIAGILPDIQADFGINDAKGGLLQTAFVLSYMLFAPLFGYLGDRYSRKYIMAFGVFLWSLTTLLGSFMPSFGGFLAFRACVGIGEASYSTIAPTIISDLFVKDLRSKMLALFYFAIPVGSGLGYIIGSQTAAALGSWHWGLRVTPVLGAIAVALILLVLQDPARGESEGSEMEPTSWGNDLKSLAKNPSFMLSTFGFTCVAFVAGALAWWGPKFIHSGLVLQPGMGNATLDDVSFKFGVIAMAAGLVGVPLGSFLAQRLRVRWPQADPLLCATGLLLSSPFIFFGLVLADKSVAACYLMVFLGEVALNLNWSIVADMLLYVVVPTRRSTAEAFQILVSHALGDAGSPYLVGVISDMLNGALRPAPAGAIVTISSLNATMTTIAPEMEDPVVAFHSLQYALFTTTFVEVLGGFFFLMTAIYIVRDKLRCERAIAGSEQPQHLYAEDSEPTR